jgi:hypothetical protein
VSTVTHCGPGLRLGRRRHGRNPTHWYLNWRPGTPSSPRPWTTSGAPSQAGSSGPEAASGPGGAAVTVRVRRGLLGDQWPRPGRLGGLRSSSDKNKVRFRGVSVIAQAAGGSQLPGQGGRRPAGPGPAGRGAAAGGSAPGRRARWRRLGGVDHHRIIRKFDSEVWKGC